MVNVNEYFGGNVKSLNIHGACGRETVGVMNPGEYEFETGLKEIVTVLSGAMTVKLPEDTAWQLVEKGELFEVAAGCKFQLKIYIDTAYLCQFVG